MRRFRFRLEKLLVIRRYREREWEIRLAGATRIVLETKGRIALAEDGIARSFGRSGAEGGAPLETGLVISSERYRQGMSARIRSLEGDLVKQEAELAGVREGYLDASRRRKVLDKLKERQADATRRRQGREESAALNDLAVSRATRWEEPPEPLPERTRPTVGRGE